MRRSRSAPIPARRRSRSSRLEVRQVPTSVMQRWGSICLALAVLLLFANVLPYAWLRGRAPVPRRIRQALAFATKGGSSPAKYPALALDRLGQSVSVLRDEPPVYMVHGVLTQQDCETLMQLGRDGMRPEVTYTSSVVVFDEDRTKPLFFVPPLAAVLEYFLRDGDLLAVLAGFVATSLGIIALREGVRWYLQSEGAVEGRGGARFTGTKWQMNRSATAATPPAEADLVAARLFERVGLALGAPGVRHLEPPLLTRYREGEGQAEHIDANVRPAPGADDEAKRGFDAKGGQRVVQCLVYLNDLDIDRDGGATAFTRGKLAGLRVRPEAGGALVFCTAFADGEEDARMVHCAEPLKGEVEKWIVPIWRVETEHAGWHKLEVDEPLLQQLAASS
mmetsp:Transcript_83738/g.240686  ORF Transcript_83738/g.240686 Transcript_83738/m.240686 type:complete len:392 (-) Transcript_83738:410-1585(-)